MGLRSSFLNGYNKNKVNKKHYQPSCFIKTGFLFYFHNNTLQFIVIDLGSHVVLTPPFCVCSFGRSRPCVRCLSLSVIIQSLSQLLCIMVNLLHRPWYEPTAPCHTPPMRWCIWFGIGMHATVYLTSLMWQGELSTSQSAHSVSLWSMKRGLAKDFHSNCRADSWLCQHGVCLRM